MDWGAMAKLAILLKLLSQSIYHDISHPSKTILHVNNAQEYYLVETLCEIIGDVKNTNILTVNQGEPLLLVSITVKKI